MVCKRGMNKKGRVKKKRNKCCTRKPRRQTLFQRKDVVDGRKKGEEEAQRGEKEKQQSTERETALRFLTEVNVRPSDTQ